MCMVKIVLKGCDCMFYKDNDVPESRRFQNIQLNLEEQLWKKELKN